MSHNPKRARLDSNAAPHPIDAATVAAERACGITEYVAPALAGFSGVLKRRYTDFLVNEIMKDGTVVHLTDMGVKHLNPPAEEKKEEQQEQVKEVKKEEKKEEKEEKKPKEKVEEKKAAEDEVSEDDLKALAALTDEATVNACVALLGASEGSVVTPAIDSKDARSSFHQLVRSAFSSRLITTTQDGGNGIIVKRANKNSATEDRRRSKRGGKNHKNKNNWDELGGEYCHFTLYKENRDTMEIVNLIPRLLKMKSGAAARNSLSFAGTKDRRAVTAQRCAAWRVKAERLAGLNTGNGGIRAARLGDFEYKPYRLDLGDLAGNEFVITLRSCQGAELESTVRAAVASIRSTGFANYFGLQRFGTFENAGTATIGTLLLQSNWRAAVETILAYDHAILAHTPPTKLSSDEVSRAEACRDFFSENWDAAANKVPRRYIAEAALLRYFAAWQKPAGHGLNYLAAIQSIPRNLRSMYVHAFQSLVWNHAVSARLRLSRTDVLEGDLVYADTPDAPAPAADAPDAEPEVDQNGEAVFTAAPEAPAGFTAAAVHALTAEDVASGRYSLADIILPTPGWGIVYPAPLLPLYTSLLAEHGLDPHAMKRPVRDFSLPGSYRKVLSRFLDDECTVEVVPGCALETQPVLTDLQRLLGAGTMLGGPEVGGKRGDGEGEGSGEGGEGAEGGEKRKREEGEGEGQGETAVVVRMRLGTSCYATMALREMMKGGTIPFRAEFGRGEKAAVDGPPATGANAVGPREEKEDEVMEG
ncbi:pseudouridine synthase [Geopyxis carbonaria]|nr:pseudouridine synthase [Geopyxis carbonaria]